MKDIAPELLEKIKKSFEEGMEQNGAMKKLEARLKSGEGGFEEAEQYAGEVGRALSAAFGEHLSSDVLPDGRMYFNIADRVVTPLMEEEYRLATEAGMEAVRAANERAGIHLQGREPAFEPERVKGIVDRLASEESFDAVKWILGDPVESYAVHCVDETVKKNAEFLHKAGRTARIRRDSASRCCDWCAALDGVYEYPGVPREIYARHNNCTCTVEYLPGDGKAQDVWSKNSRDASTREERRIFSERAISKEEAEERIRRAEEIKKSLQEQGKGGSIKSGGIFGALDPNSGRAHEHAERYYAAVRKMKTDCYRISQNTGFSLEDIEAVKSYVFGEKHDLGGKEPEFFMPSYEMAESWQRLMEGKSIQQHDMTLLRHELMEKELVDQGISQAEAHIRTSRIYNYSREAKEYYDQIAKHK